MKRILTLLLLALAFNGLAHAADTWWNDKWTLRKKITVDTTANGGAITDPIGTTPVLIRLADFNFSAARDDGSDIRIIDSDGKTSLPYHIEKYDSLLGEAFVWVSVPNLKPGATTTLYLYYGNQGDTAVATGDGHGQPTYDGDTTLVYHFADKSGTPPADSTANGNTAQNAGLSDDGSLIGPGLRLDGKAAVVIPASGSLAWPSGSPVTWSAWIKPAALTANAILFSRRDGANDFLVGLDNGVPFADINGTRSSGGTPIAANSWHHLAVVAEAAKTTVYLDGVAYGTAAAGLSTLNSVSRIGTDDPAATNGYAPFVGEIDELEISKTARGPGYIKFAALEQAADPSKIFNIGQDEAPPAGWLSGALGLFGVILKSVTIDGWVVIGILGIMSIVSWYVMITKFFYVLNVKKCNELFLREWEMLSSDLTAIDHSDVKSIGGEATPRIRRMIHRSPLYRIYHIGSGEIHRRVTTGMPLSTRSIQAIRAALDGGYIRENHKLNDGLVFLTISIAGGPFMGLLGTVVGVMITFAAIAATGEVNISAIAPGLAAALVATVAGLLVAIPALLGYNYLVAQLKTVTADLQIFIDEFVTKMAEFYAPESAEVTHTTH
ncbi:MAG TPA: MotA/TolQ/ExbB proton channel family protein [Candidatus Methylacidiphilales bacterium]|jgi:biopolymer transport protein ExbB|nr:MotA/TolQ/ExbB proton channel family protein [Candidatus Methylacidiphilales bacterium]